MNYENIFKHLKNKFRRKRVLIMGLGLHGGGVAAARFFHSLGAKLTITDIKTKSQLSQSLEKLKGLKGIKYTLGEHGHQDFEHQDFIVKNPGVPLNSPYLQIAGANHIPIITDIGILFSFINSTFIGITGTKGKSTTSSLIYQALKEKYKNIYLLGNIREPVFAHLLKVTKADIIILELSSFQLEAEDIQKSPHIAVITPIFKDHLNHHKTFKEYITAKKKIFKFQKSGDWIIMNAFSQAPHGFYKKIAAETPSKIFNAAEKQFGEKTIKQLRAIKNYSLYKQQFLSVLAVAKIYKVPFKRVLSTFQKFKPLEGRLEKIKEINDITFINDTTATNPDAAIFALNNIGGKGKLILIAGGQDKNLDYEKMAKTIALKTKTLILLPGNASNKIEQKLKAKNEKIKTKIVKVKNMKEAVRKAYKNAQSGDIILLSPGAASFGLFKHEFDRGEKFVEAIKKVI